MRSPNPAQRCFGPSFRPSIIILVLTLSAGWTTSLAAQQFPGPAPGKASATVNDTQLILENGAIAATWNLTDGRFKLAELADRLSGSAPRIGAKTAFVVELADGRTIGTKTLRLSGKPTLKGILPRPDAVRTACRSAGWRATVPLVSADGNLQILWQAVLRDGSNYISQQVTIRVKSTPVHIKHLASLFDGASDPEVAGVVDGSPVVAGNWFFACEHPMAVNRVDDGRVVCRLPRFGPLEKDGSWTVRSVAGVVPAGQLRRAFSYYIERERPRPYQPFLHYNSWYDIAWPDRKMNEGQCLTVIDIFGRELVEKRGTKFDSFVFDDGWDDNRTLWLFHKGFPDGFAPLTKAAETYDSAVGVWLSPWGGYSTAKKERLKYGKTQGFETNARGFSLAGPKYYARFHQACSDMIRKYDVNYFKFDGLGAGNGLTGAGAELGPDIEAMLRLIGDLRELRPDLFVNVTTGTWPSPYWLWHGDSIWRNGHDCSFYGEGSMRQQWITYRDMVTHKMIYRRAPLFPVNSLMVQGICYAQLGTATKMGDDLKDLVDEMRMLFASGTQLQELYVTPQMMTPPMWDTLAEGAIWSRANADVLVDVHFIGGDPVELQPYGYASWSPRKGILALRNPGKQPATMEVDLQTAFELPKGASRRYALKSPWKNGPDPKLTLEAGKPHVFKLDAFESLVLEAIPVK